MWTRADLKSKAKLAVKSNYWGLVLVSLVLGFATGGGGVGARRTYNYNYIDNSGGNTPNTPNTPNTHFNLPDISVILAFIAVFFVVFLIVLAIAIVFDIFVRNPLEIGAQRYFIESVYKPGTYNGANCLGTGFAKGRYSNVVKTLFLRDMYIGLWSLLFIIPGIVKAYEYRMMPYILAENPDMDPDEVFILSKQMMNGEKWNAFILDLSFILWHLVAIFTFFLLEIFWIAPYVAMTNAYLYEALKRKPGRDYFDPLLGGKKDWENGGFGGADPGAYGQGYYDGGNAYGQGGYNTPGAYDQNSYNTGNVYGQGGYNAPGAYDQNSSNAGNVYGQGDYNTPGAYDQNGYNAGNVYGQGGYNTPGAYDQNSYNAGNVYGQGGYNTPGAYDQNGYNAGNVYDQDTYNNRDIYGNKADTPEGNADTTDNDIFGPGGFEI